MITQDIATVVWSQGGPDFKNMTHNRTRFDYRKVRLPYRAGMGLHDATPGVLITYEAGRGIVLGRIAEGRCEGHILTLEISDDLSSAYERWIDPVEVTGARELPRAFLAFLSGLEVSRRKVPSLLRDVEYGAINDRACNDRPARNPDGSRK